MKLRLLTIFFLLLSFAASAQVQNAFRGTLNVFGFSGTGPNYSIQGFFNDTAGNFASDSVEVGDILYMSSGSECVRFLISVINDNTGGIINADIVDIDGVTSVFPGGIGAILQETTNNAYPTYVDGISDDLLACVRTHFTLLVDLAAGSTLTASDGQTVDHSISNDTLTSEVIISSTAGNTTIALSDGIYTPDTITDNKVTLSKLIFCAADLASALDKIEEWVYIVQDGSTIDFTTTSTGDGCAADTLTAEVVISPNVRNALTDAGNGLFVPPITNIYTYQIGTDPVMVRASDTTITYSVLSGVATLTVPIDVEVFDLAINGATADLAGDNSFTITIDYTTLGFNTDTSSSLTDFFPPQIDVINTASVAGGGPSPALPFVYDEGSTPQRQVTALGGGDVSVRIVNLNAFSNWSIRMGL